MIYQFYKVNKAEIAMIKFLLEAHENMVQVSTVDEHTSKIQITIAPDFLDDVSIIIEDLKERFYMQKLDGEDETKSQGNY